MRETLNSPTLPENDPAGATTGAPRSANTSIDVPQVPGYEIGELIGRGGMGKVYKARHLALNRVVAIKFLIGAGDEPKLFSRFELEAQSVALLQHPNIVQAFDIGNANGSAFYVMEFIAGGTLSQFLGSKPQNPIEAARIVETIARGTQYAHENMILHRDLKPGNILIAHSESGPRHSEKLSATVGDASTNEAKQSNASGSRVAGSEFQLKIADFGLVKRFTENDANLTHTGEILGTPSYMPPEQASGIVRNIGPAADIYALGAILYECLTGRPPFAGPDAVQTILQVLSMEPISPRQLQPRLPADIETICLKCLEKSPRKRYATAGDLAEDLRRFREGLPIVARPVRSWERAWKWARRKPWQAAASLLAVTTLIASVSGVVLLQSAYREIKRTNGQLGESNSQLESTNEQLKKSNDDLIAQKKEADTVIALALQDLDKFTFDISNKLNEMPKSESIRRDLLDEARKSLAELDKLRPKDESVRHYSMVGYDKLAQADNRLGRYPAALESQKQALRLADELLSENPTDSSLKRKRAAFLSKVYLLSLRLGQNENVMQYLRDADELCKELLKETPDDVDLLKISSMAVVNDYQEGLMAKDEAKASANIRKYAAIYERIANLFPNDESRTADFADAQLQLVSYLNNHGGSAEALTLLQATQKRFASRKGQPTTRSQKLQANLDWTTGDVLATLGKNSESEAAYVKSAKEFESLLLDFPKTRDLRWSLAQVYWAAGRLWHYEMQPEKARPYLLKAKEVLTQFKTDNLEDDQSKVMLGYVEELLNPVKK